MARTLLPSSGTIPWSNVRIIVRCWVAAWACALTLIIRPSERVAGQAAFLPLIFILVKPPSDPTLIVIVQSLLGAFVVCITWGWSVLAAKLADLARNRATDAATFHAVLGAANATAKAAGASQAGPGEIEAQLIGATFSGQFLQAQSTAVYATFLFVGTYVIWLLRAYQVRLFYVMVFAAILLDIFCTIGPLVPQFYGATLSWVFMIPYGYYLAIMLASAIFIFPNSVTSFTQEKLVTLSQVQLSSLTAFASLLEPKPPQGDKPSDARTARQSIYAKLVSSQATVAALTPQISVVAPYLTKEPTWGRRSGRDVYRLIRDTRAVSISLSGLMIFARHVVRADEPLTHPCSTSGADTSAEASADEGSSAEDKLASTLADVSREVSPVMEATKAALEEVISFNERSIRFWPVRLLTNGKGKGEDRAEVVARMRASKDALVGAMEQLRMQTAGERPLLTAEAGRQFEEDRKRAEGGAAEERGIADPSRDFCYPAFEKVLCVFHLLQFAAQVANLLSLAIRLEVQEPKFHWPMLGSKRSKRAVETNVKGTKDDGGASAGSGRAGDRAEDYDESDDDDNDDDDASGGIAGLLTRDTDFIPDGEDDPSTIQGVPSEPSASRALEPAAQSVQRSPPRRSPLGLALYNSGKWFFDVRSSFSLKVALLAVALSVPAWIKDNKSAEFYYRNKGLWTVTTATFAYSMYSGETAYGFVQRVVGTIVGGAVGLAMWYIGNGRGHNAYGMATVWAVVLPFALYRRIYSTNFILSVTVTTTLVLVTGYSWQDATLPAASAPGEGWEVWWKRTVLVLVGVAAACVMSWIPKPTSGRVQLRKTYSTVTLELGRVLAELLASIRSQGASRSGSRRANARVEGRYSKDDPTVTWFLEENIAKILLAIHQKLNLSQVRLALAKLEPSLRGGWSNEHYAELMRLQSELVDVLGQLFSSTDGLSPRERSTLLGQRTFADDHVSAMLTALYAISSSLRKEAPLPRTSNELTCPTLASELSKLLEDFKAESPSTPSEGHDAEEEEKATAADRREGRTRVVLAVASLVSVSHLIAQIQRECEQLFGVAF